MRVQFANVTPEFHIVAMLTSSLYMYYVNHVYDYVYVSFHMTAMLFYILQKYYRIVGCVF
jgi:hypothetical protein